MTAYSGAVSTTTLAPGALIGIIGPNGAGKSTLVRAMLGLIDTTHGSVTIDGTHHKVANRDIVYVGRGARSVTLERDDAARPARFYMNSVPAGADIPHRLITRAEGKPLDLGDAVQTFQRARQPIAKLRKRFLLIEDWDDERIPGGVHGIA